MLVHSAQRDAERVGVVVIHGVGGASPGWINRDVIERLQKYGTGLEFEDHSEVRELEVETEAALGGGKDGAASASDARFLSYLRRAAQEPGKNIVFMELFWADLSRVGRGPVTAFFEFVKLFYEAPLVLSAAFLRPKAVDRRSGQLAPAPHGLRRVIAHLIGFANLLLRWPISGLNASAFFCALFLGMVGIARTLFPASKPLQVPDVYLVGGFLALIAVVALWLTRRNDHNNILRREVAPSTAVSAVVLLLALVYAYEQLGPERLQGPEPYLQWVAVPILLLWLLWSHIVVAGILLMVPLGLAWRLTPKARRGETPMRPAAALGMTMIQGVIWKIVIAATWFGTIAMLVPGSVNVSQCAWQGWLDCQTLNRLNSELIVIVGINVLMAGVIAIFVSVVLISRRINIRLRLKAVKELKVELPRLIVSGWVVGPMYVLTLFNFSVFYLPRYLAAFGWDAQTWQDYDVVRWTRALVLDSGALAPGVGSALFVAMGGLLLITPTAWRGVLHIVRDIVDHQYVAGRVRKRKQILSAPWSKRGLSIATELDDWPPRRKRILKRLDTLVKKCLREVDGRPIDRLIMIGHSQGSVILYDYLNSEVDDQTLADLQRIDILTLGSPLGHVYQRYFADYQDAVPTEHELNPKLRSWINMWRADDPIAHRIDLVEGDFIKNVPLDPGGHEDYWKEEAVCKAIVDLIELRRTPRPPPLPASIAALV